MKVFVCGVPCCLLPSRRFEPLRSMNFWTVPSVDDIPPNVSSGTDLEPRTAVEVEAVERRRWLRLVQEAWLRRGRRVPLSEREPPVGGIAAEAAVVPAVTTAVVVSININPLLWGEEGDGNQEENSIQALDAPYVFGWRSLGLLPGDSFNILGELGKQLERRYQALSKRSLMVKHCHNTEVSRLHRGLMQCRERAGGRGKVIFHYGGYGVPRPQSGLIYLMEPSGSAVKCRTRTLFEEVGLPLVVVADCPNASELLRNFLRYQSSPKPEHNTGSDAEGDTSFAQGPPDADRPTLRVPHEGTAGVSSFDAGSEETCATSSVLSDFFFLGATFSGELPQHPKLPSDILTSCLMTPLQMALLWFMVENDSLTDIHPLLPFLIPGALDDKKTPLGQLHWATMAIMECIAWSSLPYKTFVHLFREDVVVAPLFRGFLLAERIITALGGEVCVYPPLPHMGNHPQWDSLDCIIGRTFVSLKRAVQPAPPTSLTTLEFREWLDWNVTKWRCEQRSMSLPSLGNRPVTVPDFLEEELRCLMAVAERVTEQSLFHCGGIAWHQCRRPGHIGPHRTGPRKASIYRGMGEEAAVDPLLACSTGSNDLSGCGCSGGAFMRPFPSVAGLPMLLQGLLVVAHRDEAMKVLCRFIDAGLSAAAACAKVGIFDMALARFWSRSDLQHLLPSMLFVYAKACYADPSLAGLAWAQRSAVTTSCLKALERPFSLPSDPPAGPGLWQCKELGYWLESEGQRVLSSAILSMTSFSFDQDRKYLLESGALNLCSELLRDASVRVPLLQRGSAEVYINQSRGSRVQHHFVATTDAYAARLTTSITSLLALFVALTWKASALEPGAARPIDTGTEGALTNGSGGEQKLGLEELASPLKTLHLLSWASSSIIRGAALKAISMTMSSSCTDEAASLRCIHIIVECANVLVAPREGNMSNRIDLVDIVFLSIRWLVRYLSAHMPMETVRASVQCASEKIYRASEAGEGGSNCGGEEDILPGLVSGTRSLICDIYFPKGCPLESCPSKCDNDRAMEVGCPIVFLARLVCWTGAATHDPCPYVSSRAEEALSCLPPLSAGGFFTQPTTPKESGAVEKSTKVPSDAKSRRFLSMLRSSVIRVLKRGMRGTGNRSDGAASRGKAAGVERDRRLSNESGGAADVQTLACDAVLPRRIVSTGSGAAVASFVFTLLGFLDELLLVPMDDDDPRNTFNLRRDFCMREYVHKVRNELRLSAPPAGYSGDSCNLPAVPSPPLPTWSPPVSHVEGVKPLVDEEREPSGMLSPTGSQLPLINLSITSDTSLGASAWSRPDSNVSFEHDGHIGVMAFHMAERHLVTGTSHGTVQVWSWSAEEHLTAMAGRSSTALSAACSLTAATASASTSPATSVGVGSTSVHVKATCRWISDICVPAVTSWVDPVAFARTTTLYNQQQQSGPRKKMTSGIIAKSSDGWVGLPWNIHSAWQCPEEDSPVISEHCATNSTKSVTGLHFVDAAYRTLLCVVGSSGSVQLFTDYAGGTAVKRVTSFATAACGGRCGGGRMPCLSSYHVPATLLHVSGPDGLIDSWDLVCEHKVLEGIGSQQSSFIMPSVITPSSTDDSTVAVGGGSVYLFDLRKPARATCIFPSSAESEDDAAKRPVGGAENSKGTCLHISFPYCYPHVIVTGYGGAKGVVTLWDKRFPRDPLRQVVVAEPVAPASSALRNPVCRMDVQPYHQTLSTVSATADAIFISDVMEESAVNGQARASYTRVKELPGAVAFHPILPICAVATGGPPRIYGRSTTCVYD